MNKLTEFYRVVVVRTAQGDKQHTARQPITPKIRVPVMEAGPRFGPPRFGCIDYQWDGKETNVSGFPVYR